MKITFSNLGAIKKTTLDLRPLTVIIGPNNSNKTYIAYSIYGLLRRLGRAVNSSYLVSLGMEHFDEETLKGIKKLYEFNNEVYSLNINNIFFQLLNKECLEQIRSFEQELEVFFQDSSKKIFKETRFEIEFTNNEVRKSLEKLIVSTRRKHGDSFQLSLDKNIIRAKSNSIFFEKEFFLQQIAFTLGFDLKQLLFFNPVLLPAERNALIITYKILESRRYDLLRDADRKSIQQPSLPIFDEELNFFQQRNIRYPEPIEDFLKFLTNLELKNNLEKGNFSYLADDIEKNLQQNNKTNYSPTKIGGKEIKINVKKGLNIDLYNASSSIKQLAPLLLYLRYHAQENDLLIIDEPEMNLHPESQAKLLEVLGMLVNAGVNVLLTTHSPYFMSHLNNLISGDMTDEKIREKQAKSLYLEDARAFLSPNDVSAYEMKKDRLGNQKLHDLKKDKDYGISWGKLSDVSADIQQKFFEIYEKGEKTSNEK